MKRQLFRSGTRTNSVRPSLESLEGREVPSGTGLLMNIFVNQPVQQATMKVQADFSTLQKDVTSLIAKQPLTTASAPAIKTDMAALQTDFNTLVGATQQGELLFFVMATSGSLDGSDGAIIGQTFNSLHQANAEIKSLPGQVAAEGAQPVVVMIPGLSPVVPPGILVPIGVPVDVVLNVGGQASLGLTSPPPSNAFVPLLNPFFGG
jgi:hypothetical protein